MLFVKAKKIWESTKVETLETKIAVNILIKILCGRRVSNGQKKFLKEQSKDLVKIIPLIIFPLPILPIFIIIGKKYNLDIFPKDHRALLCMDN